MKLYLTMCGRQQKVSVKGEEYGWASTMFCTVEDFWPPEVIDKVGEINAEDAEAVIIERIIKLNPSRRKRKSSNLSEGESCLLSLNSHNTPE